MLFTESNYENAVLQLFTQTLGYSHVYGPDIERDYHSPLYEEELLPALRAVNPSLPQAALDDAVYKLKNFESGSLLQKKHGLHRLSAKRRAGEIYGEGRGALRPCVSSGLPEPGKQPLHRHQPVDRD